VKAPPPVGWASFPPWGVGARRERGVRVRVAWSFRSLAYRTSHTLTSWFTSARHRMACRATIQRICHPLWCTRATLKATLKPRSSLALFMLPCLFSSVFLRIHATFPVNAWLTASDMV